MKLSISIKYKGITSFHYSYLTLVSKKHNGGVPVQSAEKIKFFSLGEVHSKKLKSKEHITSIRGTPYSKGKIPKNYVTCPIWVCFSRKHTCGEAPLRQCVVFFPFVNLMLSNIEHHIVVVMSLVTLMPLSAPHEVMIDDFNLWDLGFDITVVVMPFSGSYVGSHLSFEGQTYMILSL